MTGKGRPSQAAAGAEPIFDRFSVRPASAKVSTVSRCLWAARAYAQHGVGVFPLSAGKKPLHNCWMCRHGGPCAGREQCRCGLGTCHGFYAATTNVRTITNWWMTHPHWQLGIRTGAESGLVVLDVDLDKHGLDSLITLQRAGLEIAGTAVQLTGSGKSFHLIYAHPGHRVPCSQGRLGPGLDVRGDGGYVVGAPSRHQSTGAAYELLGDLSRLAAWPMPSIPAVAERPGAVPAVTPQRVSSVAAAITPARVKSWVAVVCRAPEGTRRTALLWAACRLGESVGSQSARMAAAKALLQAAEDVGLNSAEAYATVLDGTLLGGAS